MASHFRSHPAAGHTLKRVSDATTRWSPALALRARSADHRPTALQEPSRHPGSYTAFSGPHRGELVLVELQEVVGGGDQSPLRPRGRSSAALEAIDATVELCLSEHRLDHRLAFSIERASEVALKHSPHVRIGAAIPSRTGAFALAGVGRDEHLDPAVNDVLHLHLMLVAGV